MTCRTLPRAICAQHSEQFTLTHDKIGVIDGDGGVWREGFAEVDYAEGRGEIEIVGCGCEEGDFDVGIGLRGIEGGGRREVGGGGLVLGTGDSGAVE